MTQHCIKGFVHGMAACAVVTTAIDHISGAVCKSVPQGSQHHMMIVCKSSWNFCIVHVFLKRVCFACSHWATAVAGRPQDTSLASPRAAWLPSFQYLRAAWH